MKKNIVLSLILIFIAGCTTQPPFGSGLITIEKQKVEIVSERRHNIKVFDNGNGTKSMRVGSANYHYFDGKDFKDIPNLPFPEGKLIKSDSDLSMVNVPEWGRAELEENDEVVRIYDKKDVPIYRFHSPAVAKKDDKAFILKEEISPGKQIDIMTTDVLDVIKKSKDKSKFIIKIPNEDKLTKVKFEIKNNKIFFKLPDEIESKDLRAYDDTDTTSTNNKDGGVDEANKTTNYGTGTARWIGLEGGNGIRFLSQWTLPIVSGTISKITLNLYESTNVYGTVVADLHELIRSDWVEDEFTWNIYKTGSNWTTAGGDYSATIVDTTNMATIAWQQWVLLGTGSTNPITATWGDTIDLIIKDHDESGSDIYELVWTKEHDGLNPYIEITYESATADPCTPTAGQPFFQSQDCYLTTDVYHNDKWIDNGYKLIYQGGRLILE